MYDQNGRFDYGWNIARDDRGELKPEYREFDREGPQNSENGPVRGNGAVSPKQPEKP